MAITVSDVEDLLRVLRENPEWRQRVRLEILGEEILSLPERMAGVERQLELLVQGQQELQRGQAELREAVVDLQRSTVAMQGAITDPTNKHGGRLDNLDGRVYESSYNALSRVGARYRRAQRVHKRVGLPARAVVGGRFIQDDARAFAGTAGVAILVDRTSMPPR